MVDHLTREFLNSQNLKGVLRLQGVTANFNAVLPEHLARKLHINPAPAVRLALDKLKLFQKLEQLFPRVTPTYGAVKDIFYGSTVSVSKVESMGFDIGGELIIRSDSFAKQILGLKELLELRHEHVTRTAVILQTLEQPHVKTFTCIPPLRGVKVFNGKTLNTSGVFSNDNACEPHITKEVLNMVEELNIDYGRVSVAIGDDAYQILNISTGLCIADIPAINLLAEKWSRTR